MSPLSLAHAPAAHRPAGRGLLRRLTFLVALRRQRAQLARLDPHLLRDIGLTDGQAHAEAARPAWDVPPHWRA